VSSVVLILGPERFLASEALKDVLAREADRDVTRHEGTAGPGTVLDDVRTPTLFGGARTVVVDNAAPLFEGDALAAVAAYAQKPAPGSLLVLCGTGLDGRLKLAKQLKAAAEVIPCEPLRTWEVPRWLGARGREAHGLQMGTPAVEALLARVGEDLGALDASLVRLKEQIAPRKDLRVKDIEDSTEEHRSPVLFEASNALEARDLPGALRAIRGAFGEGIRIKQDVISDLPAIAPILLSNLHRAYSKLLRFHMLHHAGSGEAEAARQSGVSPKATSYFLERARSWRLERLLAGHRHFVAADLAVKGRGFSDPQRVLERLVVALLG